jgi:hypothetical protein
MALFFDQGDKLSKFGSDRNKNQTMIERPLGFFHSFLNDKILAISLEGLFWVGNKVGLFVCVCVCVCVSVKASQCAQPKAPIPIFDWLCIFRAILWTLNKVWPFNPMASLGLDGHSIKRP